MDTGNPFNERKITGWEYEPRTFIFHAIQSGTRSYKPDFKVYFETGQASLFESNPYEWFEVKGFYDRKSLTKLKRMKRFYPEEVVNQIDGAWFKQNRAFYRSAVPDWEDNPNQ